MTMTTSVTTQLAEQLDFHWTHALRPRLDGLTDDEYFWQPVPDCWTVHPNGGDRLRVSAAGAGAVHDDRVAARARDRRRLRDAQPLHFGGARGRATRPGRTPRTRRRRCVSSTSSTEHWIDGVRGLSDDDLSRPCGPAEGPYADYPMAALVLHINREVIHHGAEIACIRDLYVHTTTKGKLSMPAMPPPHCRRASRTARVPRRSAARVPRGRVRPDRRAGAVHADGQRAVDRRPDQARHRMSSTAGWSGSPRRPR